MPAGLLEQLPGRVTFVVGKGGVGKTTIAGGLALHLADHGTRTHLLSTDPAHSLGDLFGADLGSAATPSPCTDGLFLEELDAAAFADARLRSLAPGLRELIDRGTYLDVEDADALLDAAIPGLDEVGAALRIAALTGTRLVVDTAPTGHTLRLLRTPDVVRSWLHVFDAMAGKADAVASALVGESVRMSGEVDLERLAEEMAAFERAVASADFLVVTGPGEVEAAETRRLIAALEERGLRVAAIVARDRGHPAADFLLPDRPGLGGCEGLRRWWTGSVPGSSSGSASAGQAVAGQTAASRVRAESMELTASPELESSGALPPELDRHLVVFAGKGGVGKSTCAAATAVRLAETDRVLLMGADPAGSLHDILGGDTVEGLEVRELDGDAELDRFRSLYQTEVERAFEAIGLDQSARLDRAVVESLWELAPPGLDELMAVSRLAGDVEGGRRVVLDTAPTGHFLRLVGMPDLALDWVRRLMRILIKYSAMGDLDAPAEQLLRFARRFRTLRDRLADGQSTAIVVVTLDEGMVRAETERLVARIEALGLPLAGVMVNRTTRPVEARGAAVTWRAPEVEEPKGVAALQHFTRAWERVS